MNKPLKTEDDYLEAIKDEEFDGYENHYLKYLPEKYKTVEFLKRIIDEDITRHDYYYLFQYFPNEFRDNKEIFMMAVSKQGLSLNLASDRLKNDKEVVLAALNKNMQARYYIGETLKKELESNAPYSMLEYLPKAIIKEQLEKELLLGKTSHKKPKV